MSNLVLRPYRADDEPLLASLPRGRSGECPASYPRPDLRAAVVDGAVAGFSYLSPGFTFFSLYVLPSFRRRGVGTALCRDVEARVLARGDRELFTEYEDPEPGASFARSMGVAYTTSSLLLTYAGPPLPEAGFAIRPCRRAEYDAFNDLWTRSYTAMHRRIGLPAEAWTGSDAANRASFQQHPGDSYVLERDGRLAAVGSVSGQDVGCVAVDPALANRGLGTAMTAFLTNEILRRGHPKARLACETGNDNALHLYEKLGYRRQYTVCCAVKKLT